MFNQFSENSLTILALTVLKVVNLIVELVTGESWDAVIVVVIVEDAAVFAFDVVVLHAVFVKLLPDA